jgi:anti-anti-sigma factor
VDPDIVTEKRGQVDIVTVKSILGSDGVSHLERVLHDIQQQDGRFVVLDLAALEYLTSGGMLVIRSAAKQLQQTDGALVLVRPTDCVQRALHVAALTSSFPIFPDVDAAIEALGGDDG